MSARIAEKTYVPFITLLVLLGILLLFARVVEGEEGHTSNDHTAQDSIDNEIVEMLTRFAIEPQASYCYWPLPGVTYDGEECGTYWMEGEILFDMLFQARRQLESCLNDCGDGRIMWPVGVVGPGPCAGTTAYVDLTELAYDFPLLCENQPIDWCAETEPFPWTKQRICEHAPECFHKSDCDDWSPF